MPVIWYGTLDRSLGWIRKILPRIFSIRQFIWVRRSRKIFDNFLNNFEAVEVPNECFWFPKCCKVASRNFFHQNKIFLSHPGLIKLEICAPVAGNTTTFHFQDSFVSRRIQIAICIFQQNWKRGKPGRYHMRSHFLTILTYFEAKCGRDGVEKSSNAANAKIPYVFIFY